MAIHIRTILPAVTAFGIMMQITMPASAQQYGGPGVSPGNSNADLDNMLNNGTSYNAAPGNYNAAPGNYNAAPGNYNAAPGNYNAAPVEYQRGRCAYVPAGMTLPVALNTSISTDVAKPGDLVEATLTQPINLGNTFIPPGSKVVGQVVSAKSGGFLGRAGMLTIKFNSLRTPNGTQAPMSAHIVGDLGKYTQTGNGNDTFAGETWKNKVGQTALRGVLGAGTGAALGTAIGAIAGHNTWHEGASVGRGAWSGAAIGGGLGAADGLIVRKGKNVNIASGTPLQLQLDAPMTISQSVQMGAF